MHEDDLPVDPDTDDPAPLLTEKGAQKPIKDTPATRMLAEAGVPYALHPVIPELTGSMSGTEKARYLGIDSRRLFRTVIVSTGPSLVAATLPALSELDLQSLAASVGTHSATPAGPKTSKRVSGYAAQHMSPVGLNEDLPTIMDVSAMAFPSILIESGVAGLVLEVIPGNLMNVLSARTAPIATP